MWAVISYFFARREIELGAMRYESLTANVGAKAVAILLPATKNGPAGAVLRENLGVCVCVFALKVRRTQGLAPITRRCSRRPR